MKQTAKSKLSESDLLLTNFLEEFFDFYTLRKVGFFAKDMKKTDIHRQAERICHSFGYKTVFEYGAKKIRCHLSYQRAHHIDVDGELKEEPFITEIGGIYD